MPHGRCVVAARNQKSDTQLTCRRPWRHFDQKTLKETFYQPGDVIPDELRSNPYLLLPEGPDGQGPLAEEVAVPAAVGASDNEEK